MPKIQLLKMPAIETRSLQTALAPKFPNPKTDNTTEP